MTASPLRPRDPSDRPPAELPRMERLARTFVPWVLALLLVLMGLGLGSTKRETDRTLMWAAYALCALWALTGFAHVHQRGHVPRAWWWLMFAGTAAWFMAVVLLVGR